MIFRTIRKHHVDVVSQASGHERISHPKRLDMASFPSFWHQLTSVDISMHPLASVGNMDAASLAIWTGTWMPHPRRLCQEDGCRIPGDLVWNEDIAPQAT